jgi:hypothetical protein
MTDDAHCGASADCTGANAGIDCTATGQACQMGTCAFPGHVRYEETFTASVVTTPQQCTDYQTWGSNLTGTFSHMRVYGNVDPAGTTGYVCDNAGVTTQLAAAIKAGTSLVVTCGVNTWQYCASMFGGEFWVNAPSGVLCSGTDCSAAGQAMVRPCITIPGDGAGINVTACAGPTQHVVIDFQSSF